MFQTVIKLIILFILPISSYGNINLTSAFDETVVVNLQDKLEVYFSKKTNTFIIKNFRKNRLTSIDSIYFTKDGFDCREYYFEKNKFIPQKISETKFNLYGNIIQKITYPNDSTFYYYDDFLRIKSITQYIDSNLIYKEDYNYQKDFLEISYLELNELKEIMFKGKYVYFLNREKFYASFCEDETMCYHLDIFKNSNNGTNNSDYEFTVYSKIKDSNIKIFNYQLLESSFGIWRKANLGYINIEEAKRQILQRELMVNPKINSKTLSSIQKDSKRWKALLNILFFKFGVPTFSLDYFVLKSYYNFEP